MISEEQLFTGSWYALEQAGRLLRSAVYLFEQGDAGTAVALAMFAREELGRSRILRDLGGKVGSGQRVTVEYVRKRCNDHLAKQMAGQVSTTLRVAAGTRLSAALRARTNAVPSSKEWRQARETIARASRAKAKRDSPSRHQARLRGLYVDLEPIGAWTRPATLTQEAVRDEIDDAVGDYECERDQLRDEVVKQDYPGMAAVRNKMQPRPLLPDAVWPSIGPRSAG